MKKYIPDELKIEDINKVKKYNSVTPHKHMGTDSPKIRVEDLNMAFFEVVSDVPTRKPFNFVDQIKIYVNGGTTLLYVWDNANASWRRFNYYVTP